MFEYMMVQEAATKWDISERRIQTLCSENRIEGVVRLSRVWLIPKDAKKREAKKDFGQLQLPVDILNGADWWLATLSIAKINITITLTGGQNYDFCR